LARVQRQRLGGRASTRTTFGQGERLQIEESRAEILRLIDQLRERRTRTEDSGGKKAAASIDRTLREQVERIGRAAPERASRRPSARLPSLPSARAAATAERARDVGSELAVGATPRASRHILQSIEERLERIESQMQTPPTATLPGTASAPASGDQMLQGMIQGDLLSDILQLVSSNGLSGVFRVERGDTGYDLFFREGQIEHAAGSGLSGDSAFFAAFGLRTGRYAFRETTELPSEKTIDGNTQFLILEALRQIDEASGEE
jgi:hypothetical protein